MEHIEVLTNHPGRGIQLVSILRQVQFCLFQDPLLPSEDLGIENREMVTVPFAIPRFGERNAAPVTNSVPTEHIDDLGSSHGPRVRLS